MTTDQDLILGRIAAISEELKENRKRIDGHWIDLTFRDEDVAIKKAELFGRLLGSIQCAEIALDALVKVYGNALHDKAEAEYGAKVVAA